MKNFAAVMAEDRRLSILLCLDRAAGYKSNHFLLTHYLDAIHAHKVSHDVVRSDLAWLAEQGLVTLAQMEDQTTALLTTRGADVANGRAEVPGIKRPLPGA